MNRSLATAELFTCAFLLALSLIAASATTGLAVEPTPIAQPSPELFEVEVVVETEGVGIPDGAVMETNFGTHNVYRQEDLTPHHYRDSLKVRLDSAVMWLFEHEGNLSTGGQRNDESWVLYPYIVETPFTLTVSIHNPSIPCQELTMKNCDSVTGIGDNPVFLLEHNKNYDINLKVDYIPGGSFSQDSFRVTTTIR